MHLLIRAVSLAGQPLTQAISAYFDERGGTIGRADTNTLALPDPERRISRLQAEVMQGPEGFSIFNVGNANPIWQNEKAVGPGENAVLSEGDELMIGSYALQVSFTNNDETARTITRGRAAVDGRTVIVTSGLDPKTDPSLMTPIGVTTMPGMHSSPAPNPPAAAFPVPGPAASVSVSPTSPFADLLGGLAAPSTPLAPASSPAAAPASSASPFADLIPSAPATSSSPFGAPPSAFSPRSAPAPTHHLPDDFDPFADLLGSAPKPAAAPSAFGSALGLPSSSAPAARLPGDLDLMAEMNPAGAPSSLDQMFGLNSGAPSADPLADFLKKTEPPVAQAAVGAPSAVDPLALLTPAAPSETSAPHHAPLPDTTPEIHGVMPVPSLAAQLAQRMAEAGHTADEPSLKGGSTGGFAGGLSGAFNSDPQTQPHVHAVPDRIVTTTPSMPEIAAERVIRPAPAPSIPVASLEPIVTTTTPAMAALSSAPPAPAAPITPAAASHTSTIAPVDTSAVSHADSHALWAAFCEGAGVSFAPPQGLNPDLMRVMGQLLRHSIGGTVRLVAARAATKQEMRAEVTMIQARRNNPLKFSPDAQSALEQLLQPPLRGFMSGPEAVDDAMDDLLGHTIGTMAGMRAALEGVMARFEPDQLEAKLVGRSMLDSLLPMNRRAKLWELYLQHYGAVSTEAKEDFHNLFGKAFLQAYEEQLDRLDVERRASEGQGGKG